MSRFLTETQLKTLPGVDLKHKPFQLLQELVYKTDVLVNINYIRVVCGYRTDLYSIPWFVRWLISIASKGREAAIIHDYACHPRDKYGTPMPRFCSSKEAADVLEEGLIDLKVAPCVHKAIVISVRIGGPRFKKGDLWKPRKGFEYTITPGEE